MREKAFAREKERAIMILCIYMSISAYKSLRPLISIVRSCLGRSNAADGPASRSLQCHVLSWGGLRTLRC